MDQEFIFNKCFIGISKHRGRSGVLKMSIGENPKVQRMTPKWHAPTLGLCLLSGVQIFACFAPRLGALFPDNWSARFFFFFCFVFFLFCCVFLALIDFVSRSYMYCRGAWPPSSARPFLRNPWIQAQYYGKLAIHHISRFFFSVLKKIQFSSFYFFHSSSLRDSTGAKFLKSYSYNVDPISTKLHDRYVSHGGI